MKTILSILLLLTPYLASARRLCAQPFPICPAFCAVACKPATTANIWDGLIAYYRFEQSTGPDTRVNSAPGGFGGLIPFDGYCAASGKHNIGIDSTCDPAGYLSANPGSDVVLPFSFSFWFFLTDGGTSGDILTTSHASGNFAVIYNGMTGQIGYGESEAGINNFQTVGTGAWHFFVFKSTTASNFFSLDGATFQATQAGGVVSAFSGLTVGAGATYLSAASFYMDELAFFNRGLSQAEATAFYNGGTGVFY